MLCALFFDVLSSVAEVVMKPPAHRAPRAVRPAAAAVKDVVYFTEMDSPSAAMLHAVDDRTAHYIGYACLARLLLRYLFFLGGGYLVVALLILPTVESRSWTSSIPTGRFRLVARPIGDEHL